MSLYHFVKFDHVMPDGLVFDTWYTKDFTDFVIHQYYVISDDGRLLHEEDDGSFTDINFCGYLSIYHDSDEYHDYTLEFQDGFLKFIVANEEKFPFKAK